MSISADNGGFTLLELIVAMVISMFVMAAIYTLFRSSSELFVSQEQIVGVRQDIRATLSMIAHDIRMAGLDPARSASDAGIASANATSLHILYDEDGDGACDTDLDYLYVSAEDALKVQTGGGGGYQPLVYDISSVGFTYVLSDGSTTSTPTDSSMIRMVGIQLCGKIDGPYSEKYDSLQCFNSTVRCRNMGL
ncbi:MAG: prepilin-type N-terminal cleavage/methylation domain-containing protein [Desulfoplanes sp.]|nr:prepilin-type N-terminal cleavage/methylation domain-containing protein [Desulfoplanes sp.]